MHDFMVAETSFENAAPSLPSGLAESDLWLIGVDAFSYFQSAIKLIYCSAARSGSSLVFCLLRSAGGRAKWIVRSLA